jgi:hypothetical protein
LVRSTVPGHIVAGRWTRESAGPGSAAGPAGRDLVNVGWTSAIQWILDEAERTRPDADDTAEPHREDEHAPALPMNIPDELRNSLAVRCAIDAAGSPRVRATLQWLNSPAGREIARVAQTVQQGA